jgi:hypothetical protein
MQMLCGALASALVAALFDGHSAIAMTSMMALCAVAAAGVYTFVVRPVERDRIAGRVLQDAGRGIRDGRVMRGA